jgi:phenylacetate-coenzyme A ligase PaaK-like adenylate-forming protein
MDLTKVTDLLSGRNIAGYYKIYKESQWYSEEQIYEYQLIKLKALINHCYQNVPFYSNFMKKNKLSPNDLKDIGFIEQFPIITKDILLNNYNDFIPSNLSVLKKVKTSQTGGTTGRILHKRTDANTRSSTWGAYKRFYDWMGIKDEDKKMKVMGGHILKSSVSDKLKAYFKGITSNELSFDPYDNSDENINNIFHALKSNNIKLIRGYSQHLFSLGLIAKQRGDSFKVKAIMTTAEPLMLEHRNIYKEVFGAESFDQYGCGEIGGIAFECEKHNGLHVTNERVLVELDNENNMLFTDLDNFAMPYIRYRNDDQAILSDEECSCGRKGRIIKQVLGRTCDYVQGRNGKLLHWAYFWHLMFDTDIAYKRNIQKFQIRQLDHDNIIFRTVGDKLSFEDQILIREQLLEKLGDLNIEFIDEIDIENALSGKYRPVVNFLLT